MTAGAGNDSGVANELGITMKTRAAIGIFLVVGYALLAHTFSTRTQISASLLPLAFVPLACALALKPAWRKWSALLLISVAAIACNPLWLQWSAQHLAWIYFAQDTALNAGLALLFGSTLRRGEIPLCSRIALSLQPPPTAPTLRYTRAVTWAWTVFFCAVAIISTLLFLAASQAVWSAFANLLYWPLLIAMFASEYGARLLLLPRDQRSGFWATIRAFSHFHGARGKPIDIAS